MNDILQTDSRENGLEWPVCGLDSLDAWRVLEGTSLCLANNIFHFRMTNNRETLQDCPKRQTVQNLILCGWGRRRGRAAITGRLLWDGREQAQQAAQASRMPFQAYPAHKLDSWVSASQRPLEREFRPLAAMHLNN